MSSDTNDPCRQSARPVAGGWLMLEGPSKEVVPQSMQACGDEGDSSEDAGPG